MAKVNIIASGGCVYLGVIASTSTAESRAYAQPTAYCWCMGSWGLVPYSAGEQQPLVGGVGIKAGDVVLLKRSGGQLIMKCHLGVFRMPLPAGEFFVFANLGHQGDEVELVPVSPAEAASL